MLKFADVEGKVRELAAANPTYVYRADPNAYLGRCEYRPNSVQPGCVFGQALIALGAEIPAEWEGRGIVQLYGLLGIEATFVQKRWSETLQFNQDRNSSWGTALKMADEAWPLTGDNEPVAVAV